MKEELFGKRRSHQLNADGHAVRVLPRRNADSAVAGKIQGGGEDVAQIHLKRIRLFPEPNAVAGVTGVSRMSHCL